MRAILVDRRPSVTRRNAGWIQGARAGTSTPCESDVFEWLCRPARRNGRRDAREPLPASLSRGRARHAVDARRQQTRRFIACEPRRSRTALAGASLLRLIGCNDVTIHDADISVRAGFRDRELSRLWPHDSGWQLTEGRAGCSLTLSSPTLRRDDYALRSTRTRMPGFGLSVKRRLHPGMRRFVEQPEAPALRENGEQQHAFHPRKCLAHASSRPAAERKI